MLRYRLYCASGRVEIGRRESESCARDKAPFLIDNCLATVNQLPDYLLITPANCNSNSSINGAFWWYLEQIAGVLRAGLINPIRCSLALFFSLFTEGTFDGLQNENMHYLASTRICSLNIWFEAVKRRTRSQRKIHPKTRSRRKNDRYWQRLCIPGSVLVSCGE